MSLRITAAEIFRKVTPQGPLYGPPTPEGIKLPWPNYIKYNLPRPLMTMKSTSQDVYYKVKDKIFYMIRGQ